MKFKRYLINEITLTVDQALGVLGLTSSDLGDMTKIKNERVFTPHGTEKQVIFKDDTEWKWYYSDEADEYNNWIKLRTHPIEHETDLKPAPPSNLRVNQVHGP